MCQKTLLGVRLSPEIESLGIVLSDSIELVKNVEKS